MAVGLANGRHAAEEEARAEVDVLNSRLEKTTQLTKKIEACLVRLESTGKSVREVAGPLNGETKKLQVLGHNIDNILSAIERLRAPADSKNDEEQIIRMGPEKADLPNYLNSLKRLNKALVDMKASNLRSNQQTMNDLQRLVTLGTTQLATLFDKLLRSETPRSLEPLHYITKDKPFPLLSRDNVNRLGPIYSFVAGSNRQGKGVGSESTIAEVYSEVRGPYLAETLANLAAASVNTAKKKNPDAVYRAGTNGIGTYAQAMERLFQAEYENITRIFSREDWAPLFQATCQNAIVELSRTLREINAHIKVHLNTDCFLAYEIVEIISGMSSRLEDLRAAFAACLKPVRETAKTSLGELIEDTKRKVANMQSIPADGAPSPVIAETMQRLQTMVEFLRPVSSIMISIGNGGWKSLASSRGGGDALPSLASFDVGANGQEIFADYCSDTIDILLLSLDGKARMMNGKKPVVGVFIANSIAITERSIRESDLAPLMETRLGILETYRKKAKLYYTEPCKDVSMHLFDVIHTSKSARPSSGQASADSATILKQLSSKDKESIKNKFTSFNAAFDDMVARHKSFSMEREVRQMFARDMQQMLEPLYVRFWDRYHEVDKGKGKYVKYDKAAIAAVFASLY
uniref:Exocyst complex protein EXO70 n=1 Tax=Pyricularia oryzae TaxID=318829 RepID=A0A060CW34_PYROR|nr:exocyst complex subunit Exo70 [Pyricularia oryzae]